MGLSKFVLARVAEEEERARAVRPAELYAYREGGDDGWAVEGTDGSEGAIIGDRALAKHIARWDPAQVLAWCTTLRAIVGLHQGNHECSNEDDSCAWILDGDCDTNWHLALIWVDHPEFNTKWLKWPTL